MTLGARGCIHARNGMLTHVGAAVPPEAIDFVGAGDTVLASLAAALAARRRSGGSHGLCQPLRIHHHRKDRHHRNRHPG